jgi:hypothetical protein
MLIFDHTGAGGDESALKELLWRVCGHLLPATVIAALLAAWAASAAADSAEARCEVYAKGSDKMQTMVPCTFSQRQGYITIAREDGVTYSLSPAGDAAFGTCPAGILRMDSAQASIVIQSRSGAQFTVNLRRTGSDQANQLSLGQFSPKSGFFRALAGHFRCQKAPPQGARSRRRWSGVAIRHATTSRASIRDQEEADTPHSAGAFRAR